MNWFMIEDVLQRRSAKRFTGSLRSGGTKPAQSKFSI